MSESSRISYNTLTYSTTSQIASFGTFSSEQIVKEMIKNFFYPLFTEISRFGHLPHVIDVIQFILMVVQEIGVTMWCGSISICGSRGSLFDVFYWFTDWAIVRNENISDCVIQYSIGFCIFVLINLYLIFLVILYQQKRNYDKLYLVIARFLFFPLLTYLLPVYGSFIGRAFYELFSHEPNSISVTFFIFSIPIYLISMHEFYFFEKFITNTPVIDQSLIGAWNDQILFLTVFSISICSTVQPILEIFPKWLRVAALVGYVLLLSYRIYLLYFAPMLRYAMNSFFLSVCFMSIFNCVLSIVHVFCTKIPVWAYLFSSIVIFFISLIFTAFWFKSKKLKYLRQISYVKVSDESEKRNLFDSIVFSSARDAISFIHIGVMFQSETIIDLSFLRYLMENYAEPSIIIAVSKAASFFPSETRFLSYCLAEVEKKVKKEIGDDFLIYQLKHIQVTRQSSVSAEASAQLQILQKMSRDTISQVRNFWDEILSAKNDISFASLQYLRKLTIKTDSAFLDSCDSFPNNVAILNEYSRFQIEGMGNFSGAISSSKKMFLLDQGKNLTIDHAFKALVNVYPDYLLKGIFNIHGNLIRNGLLRDQSSISISMTISTQEEIEEKYDEFISQLYTHGKLRIALQRRLKNTKLLPFTVAYSLSIVQLLFFVFMCIFFIFVFPVSSNNALDAIECCNEFSKISLHLQHIACIAGVSSAIKKRAFSGVNMLRYQLGISSDDIRKDPSFFQKPQNALFNSTKKLKDQFDISTKALISTMISFVPNIYTYIEEKTEYIKDNNVTQRLSIQSSIAHFCYTAEVLSTIISTSSNKIDKLSAEILINTNTISNSLEALQASINEKGIESIQTKNYYIKTYCFVAFYFFSSLLMLLRIFNHVLIFKEVKKCSNLLRNVDAKLVKESYLPIALKGQSDVIGDTNPHSAHEYDFLLVLHPFVITLSIISILILGTLSIYFFFNSLDIIDSIFQWFLYGNVRFSSILGSLVILCSGSTNVIDHETEYKVLSEKIELLINSQKYIDLTLMKIDPKINQLYFSKRCEEGSISSYKTYSECLSLSSKIYVATSAIQNLVNNDVPLSLNNQDFATLIYLIDTYMFEDLEGFQELIVQYAFNHFESASNMTNIMCISALILSCIIFLVEQFFFSKFQQSIDAIKQLISMLPPIAVSKSNTLMNFMSNEINIDDSQVILTASESIISMTSTAAVMLNKDKIIQAVNKAVNDTTGFMPDQILGQNVNWLIPPPNIDYGVKVREVNKRFYDALDQISNQSNQNQFNIPTETQDSISLLNEFDNIVNNNNENAYNFGFIGDDDDDDLAFTSTMAVTTAPTNGNPVLTSVSNGQNDRLFMDSVDSNLNNPISLTNASLKTKKNGYAKLAENEEHFYSENVIVLTTMCLTESGSIIPMQTTILYLKDRSSFDDQYVILLRDISKEVKMLKAAQETRNKTAKLLNSLIPSSIISAILSTQSKINSAMNSTLSNNNENIDSKKSLNLINEIDNKDMNEQENKDSLNGIDNKDTNEKDDEQENKVSLNEIDNKDMNEDDNEQENKDSLNGIDNKDMNKKDDEQENKDSLNGIDNKDMNEDDNEQENKDSLNGIDNKNTKLTKDIVQDIKEQNESKSVNEENNEKEIINTDKDINENEGKESVETEEEECLSYSNNLTNTKQKTNKSSYSDYSDYSEYKSVEIEDDDYSENDNDYSDSYSSYSSYSYNSNENHHGKSKENKKGNKSSSNNKERKKLSKKTKNKSSQNKEEENESAKSVKNTKNEVPRNNEEIKEKERIKTSSEEKDFNQNIQASKTEEDLIQTNQYKEEKMNSLNTKGKNKTVTSSTHEIEKSNFFSANSVTAIIMQIVGLNEYVHILSPQQLTQHLKLIYDEFEKTSKEFPAISIIKMNIEQFVACCGLFSFFDDLNEQANQAVSYACSMNKRIEAINEELNIELRLKIGINSGGPALGSMLNPVTPSFEILGEFISIAKRIQHDGEIGKVNVSENVASKLDQKLFKIENGSLLHDDSNKSEIPLFTVTAIDNDN